MASVVFDSSLRVYCIFKRVKVFHNRPRWLKGFRVG